MANEEIEISELEFREELSGDDLIPVETSTNTFATTLTAIKNWLKSFFVGKTGNETIDGIKTFLSNPMITNNYPVLWGENTANLANSNGMVLSLRGKDINEDWAWADLYRRGESGSSEFHLYAKSADGTIANLNVRALDGGSTATGCPNPPENSNDNSIATTSWVNSKTAGVGNWGVLGAVLDNVSTYTAPADGFLAGEVNVPNGQHRDFFINGSTVCYNYIVGDRSANMNITTAPIPCKAGDVITCIFAGNPQNFQARFWYKR